MTRSHGVSPRWNCSSTPDDGELVELLDRLRQRPGRHTDLLGEFLQRVGTNERAGLDPLLDVEPAWHGRVDRQHVERVAVDLALVEHPVRRAGVDTPDSASAAQDLVAGPVVGKPLVHEALAGLVHPDAAPHHRVEHRLAVGSNDARSEPRLVEQCGVGTDVDAGERARRRCCSARPHRPLVGHRWLVLLAEFAIALEAAGGEQHAAVGEDAHPFAVAHRLDADDRRRHPR